MDERVTLAKINIVARDVAASVEFYRRVGLSFDGDLGDPDEVQHVRAIDHDAEFSIDNAQLAQLYNAEWRTAERPNSVLLTAQLPTREAVDEVYAELTAAGYRGLQVPWDAFWGARYAVVADPDGNSVGLESPRDEDHQPTPPYRSPDRPR